jgi:hypothetical protein
MPIPDDVAAFISRHTRAFLITRRRDGAPTIHPMTAFFVDGRMTMTTYRKSAKARNVEHDPRAACLVVNGYGNPDIRAALVRGRARLVRASALTVPDGGGGGAAPKVPADIAAHVAEGLRSGKRVLLAVDPDEAGFVQRLGSG